MPNINLKAVFIDKARRVNANQANEGFKTSFVNAVNETLLDLGNRVHTVGTVVASEDGDTGLDARYLPALNAGVDYYLSVRSEWKIEGKGDLFSLWTTARDQASHLYFDDNTPKGRFGSAES